LGDRRRSDTVVVSTINYTDPGVATLIRLNLEPSPLAQGAAQGLKQSRHQARHLAVLSGS